MDVLPLVPAGLLVIVVLWLVWPVFEDAIARRDAELDDFDDTGDEMAEALFDAWTARGQRPARAVRSRAA